MLFQLKWVWQLTLLTNIFIQQLYFPAIITLYGLNPYYYHNKVWKILSADYSGVTQSVTDQVRPIRNSYCKDACQSQICFSSLLHTRFPPFRPAFNPSIHMTLCIIIIISLISSTIDPLSVDIGKVYSSRRKNNTILPTYNYLAIQIRSKKANHASRLWL